MWPKKKGFRIVNKVENNANNSLFENALINLKIPYIEIAANIKLTKC